MKARTTGALTLTAVAAVGALFLLFFRGAAPELAYPAERAKVSFMRRAWSRVAGAFRGAEAAAENVRLRREVAALSLARGDAERMEVENARLRRSLGYAERRPGEWIAAEVLSRDGAAAGVRRTLRVGKGSRDGVSEGAVVVVPEGLVGRVTAVTPHTAEITLVTDPSVKVSCEAEVVSGRPMRGILCGGGDFLVMRHVTGAEGASPRTRILTSGLGGVFPKGIEVGAFVQMNGVGSALEAEVQPSVDYQALEDVFIRNEK